MKYGKVVYILDVSMKILNEAVTRSRKSNKDIYNKMNKRERKKDQQWFTNYYTENLTLNNKNPT